MFHYDGGHDHIFNWDSSTLIRHSVLNQTSFNFFFNTPSFNGIVNARNCSYASSSGQSFINLSKFIEIWFAFIRLQTWKYDWTCHICDPNRTGYVPHLVFDGLVLSVPKPQLECIKTPTTLSDHPIKVDNIRANPISDRFIEKKKNSDLWRRYVVSILGCCHRDSKKDKVALDSIEVRILRDLFQTKHEYNGMFQFMKWLSSLNPLTLKAKVRKQLKDFSRALGSREPAFQIVPPKIFGKLNDRTTINANIQKIAAASHLIGAILLDHDNPLPNKEFFLTILLPSIQSRAKTVYEKYVSIRNESPSMKEIPEIDRMKNDEHGHSMTQTGYFGVAVKRRERPKYSLDDGFSKKTNKTNKSKKTKKGKGGGESQCRKFFYQCRDLSGGIMVFRDAIHGIATSFHVIKDHEGRNDGFSWMALYHEKAPETVIADWSCQSHTYCMMEEPEFFKDTIWSNDAFHHKSHVRCSKTYDMSGFKQFNVNLYRANDSACEQGNVRLNHLRKSSRYMRLDRFMFLTRLVIEMDNRRIQNKLLDFEPVELFRSMNVKFNNSPNCE